MTDQATDTEHVYLSTGCLHGEHEYCKRMKGLDGAKTPGQCKFCRAHCICPCHGEEDRNDNTGTSE